MTATMNRPPSEYALVNEEAEESVLGAILLSPVDGATEAVDLLRPADFYRPAHQAVFEAVIALYDANEPIDPITVSSRLRASGDLERVGGIVFLARLLDQVPTASNLSYYANLVKAAAMRRQLIQAVSSIRGLAESPELEIDEILDKAEQSIFAVADGNSSSHPERVGGAVGEALEAFGSAEAGGSAGLQTGYRDVDRILGGLKPGNLAVLAARPSMGKSSWALGVAHRIAKQEIPVALFSLEMTRLELAQRLVCADGRVDSSKALRGDLDGAEWSRLVDAAARVNTLPLYIEDTGVLSVTNVRAKARRIAREAGGLGLVIVDYMQLMEGRGENRQQEIASISRGLKELARDLKLPVLALSQLNRGVEVRENKRPRLADLRDSGSIEQDSDVVMFLYREEYYSPTDVDKQGVAELEVAKHRTGRTGTVTQAFVAEYACFEDLARS